MALAGDVELISVTKRYGDTVAVDAIDLKIPQGTYCCLLGPSGCGKTSTLRMIAGHEIITEGVVRIGEQQLPLQSDRTLGGTIQGSNYM